jgi:hypothetical protein
VSGYHTLQFDLGRFASKDVRLGLRDQANRDRRTAEDRCRIDAAAASDIHHRHVNVAVVIDEVDEDLEKADAGYGSGGCGTDAAHTDEIKDG